MSLPVSAFFYEETYDEKTANAIIGLYKELPKIIKSDDYYMTLQQYKLRSGNEIEPST